MSAAPEPFTYAALPSRVVFGAGSLARLPEEVDRLGLSRVLVLCTPGGAGLGQRVAELLGDRTAGVAATARMHVPVTVAEQAREVAVRLGADGCLAVGGGSAIGLAKAVVLRHRVPVVAVPTTYAGSEMTPVWGLTEAGTKRTGRDRVVLPLTVVYDPELTLALPVATSVTSAFNALAHAVEGLWAPDASPVVSMMAVEGVRAITGALPALVADGGDLGARSQLQYGAWLCGSVLGATTMSLHHKLCHALGGALDLPHAPTHTVVLPHVVRYNAASAPAAVAALAGVLGPDPARALWDLVGRLGAPRALSDLGMAEADVAAVARAAVASPYANPREVTLAGVTALLADAWAGRAPQPWPWTA